MKSALATLLGFLCLSSVCLADPPPPVKVCDEDIEGSYVGPGWTKGAINRINLFCLWDGRLMATMTHLVRELPPSVDSTLNLSSANVFGANLILTNMPLKSEDRHSHSSKGLDTVLSMNWNALKTNKEIAGYFINGHTPEPKGLRLMRKQVFPKPSSFSSTKVPESDFPLSFTVVTNGKMKNAVLSIVIVGDTPALYLNVEGSSIRMVDSAPWTGQGPIDIYTAEGNGGEPDDGKLYNVRGFFSESKKGQGVDTFQFYFAVGSDGMKGPFVAMKRILKFKPLAPSAIPGIPTPH